MERQRTHADWTILPRGHYPKRPDVHLGTEIELTSSFIEFLLDGPAFMFMLLAVAVQTILVTIPDAQAPAALLQGIALLAARRTQLGRTPNRHILVGVLVIFGFSSRIKFLLDAVAFFSMLGSVTLLTSNVAIPNALAGCTLLEGITFLSARRTDLGRGLILLGVLVIFGILILRPLLILPSRSRSAERHGAKLLSSRRRCAVLFG